MPMLWIGHCFIDHHPRDGLAVFLLLRRVHQVSFEIDSERVHGVLHPEVFNQPDEKSIEWARHPELMQKLKQQRLEAEQRITKQQRR